MSRTKVSPERAREIGRMGKAKSYWSQEPACATPRAVRVHAQHKRLATIKAAALKTTKE